MAYWGLGAYERNSMMGGGMGMFGSNNFGGSYGGSSFGGSSVIPHPPLVKTPRAAG
jgi:hypothetical protein